MRNQVPNFPHHPFIIFEQEILKALGIKLRKTQERIEDDRLVVEVECTNVEWAGENGRRSSEAPTGLAKALGDIGASIATRDIRWSVGNPGNRSISLYGDGLIVQNAIYRQKLETYLNAVEANNTSALEKLVASGAMSIAQVEGQKEKAGKATKDILAKWDRQVRSSSSFTYKDALKFEHEELRKQLANGKNIGKKLRSPANKARRVVSLAVQNEARRSGGSASAATKASVKRSVQEAALEADHLVRVGVAGKIAYVGLILLQIGYAAEQDQRADEFETKLPDHLTKTVAGLAVGAAATALFLFLAPVGAISAIMASIIIGAAADEVVAGVFAIVKEDLEPESKPQSQRQ